MAHLDIAERRLPQDGRINLELDGQAIDVRVATIRRRREYQPTVLGQGEIQLRSAWLGQRDAVSDPSAPGDAERHRASDRRQVAANQRPFTRF
jgi:hypothetical protein